MTVSTAVALVLAALSTTITNLAYLREHDAAAALPVLSMRRPLRSLQLLLGDRSWPLGFAMETSGFLLYAAALALASLSLVQTAGVRRREHGANALGIHPGLLAEDGEALRDRGGEDAPIVDEQGSIRPVGHERVKARARLAKAGTPSASSSKKGSSVKPARCLA